ncbi:hypothetical protein GGI20_003295 [Coemansia sp. BCRC 34301]|nr:hypothetical protein GGI20_003295 [Coemansia sp. BCRC 34301]
MSASGLLGAPATKLWMAGMSLASALAGAFGWRDALRLEFLPSQSWRLVSSLSGFPTLPKVVAGLLLLYQMRAVERMLGTRRFASFLVVSGIVGQTLLVLAMALTRISVVAGGPYVMLFACVQQFYVLVPPSYARVMGIAVTDKWPAYATAAYLMAPSMAVLLPAVAGVAAGLVYGADVAGLKCWRLPAWIEDMARALFKEKPDAGPSGEPGLAEHVDAIAGMFPGVDRAHIGNVLRTVGNDPNRAVAVLLDRGMS